jgi:multiple sugar transport system substrate-binding protein
MMSDKGQVDVLAKNNTSVARSDLVDNQYSAKDPRVALINEVAGRADSKTPVAINFQQAFNAPGSPWVTLFRNQVYGNGSSLDKDNDAVTQALGQQ